MPSVFCTKVEKVAAEIKKAVGKQIRSFATMVKAPDVERQAVHAMRVPRPFV